MPVFCDDLEDGIGEGEGGSGGRGCVYNYG